MKLNTALVFIISIMIISILSCDKNKPVEPNRELEMITFEALLGSGRIDEGYSVSEISTGGFIVTGETQKNIYDSKVDVYLMKTDNHGNLLWEKTFGGDTYDRGRSVCETSTGDFVVTGLTFSFNEDPTLCDLYLIKTDSGGNLLWEKTFGNGIADVGIYVKETSDGGYIVTGRTWRDGSNSWDIYLLKTDRDGNLIWENWFGGTEYDQGCSVIETTKGEYVIAGLYYPCYTCESSDAYLIKTDKDGNLLWIKTYGGEGYEHGYSVRELYDGGYIVVGTSNSTDSTSSDIYLFKTDKDGELKWNKFIGGADGDNGLCIDITSDGGFIITGTTTSYGEGYTDLYLVKTDGLGQLVWQKTFGGTGSDNGRFGIETSDGGFIAVGTNGSSESNGTDFFLIKTDSEGNIF